MNRSWGTIKRYRWALRPSFNPWVVGSNPTRPTCLMPIHSDASARMAESAMHGKLPNNSLMPSSTKPDRIKLRLSSARRSEIELAAALSGRTVNDFYSKFGFTLMPPSSTRAMYLKVEDAESTFEGLSNWPIAVLPETQPRAHSEGHIPLYP